MTLYRTFGTLARDPTKKVPENPRTIWGTLHSLKVLLLVCTGVPYRTKVKNPFSTLSSKSNFQGSICAAVVSYKNVMNTC